MDPLYVPTDPAYASKLGRSVINHDDRNRDFVALDRVTREPQKNAGYGWARRDVYNQIGPSCTANAFAGLLHMTPFVRPLAAKRAWPSIDTDQERFDFYKLSQTLDGWPGEDYEGTSTEAPHKLSVSRGWTPSYHWLFGEAQLWEWVTWYGPASVGTMWTQEMFNPDARGFLHPTGRDAGGHEWTLVKADQAGQHYVMVNSWGRAWGKDGRAAITRADMDGLLRNNGDAVTIGT